MEVVMKYIVYSYYSRDLSQKIKTVINSKVRHGLYIGSFAPYGYIKTRSKKNHLIPTRNRRQSCVEIDMALAGKNISHIAIRTHSGAPRNARLRISM